MINHDIEGKTKKTAILIGAFNFLLSPLYLTNSNLGLATLIACNTALLYQMHELGKSRRPGSNLLNRFTSFFTAQINENGNDLENLYRNIINGGDSLFDETCALITKSPNRR